MIKNNKLRKFILASMLGFSALYQTNMVYAQANEVPANSWRRLNPENALVIDTNKGRIIVELFQLGAPNHVERIKQLTRMGFYDGLVFHRVIEGFMDQTGDPKGDGTGGSSLPDLEPEFTFRFDKSAGIVNISNNNGQSLGFIDSMPIISQSESLMEMTIDGKIAGYASHCAAIASMARADAENSANSQFFLMRDQNTRLDAHYTVFGSVVIGQEVVRAIKTGEPVINPDKMLKVRILADFPESEQPKIYIQKADGPEFQAEAAKKIAQKGLDFSICDLRPEAKIVQ